MEKYNGTSVVENLTSIDTKHESLLDVIDFNDIGKASLQNPGWYRKNG